MHTTNPPNGYQIPHTNCTHKNKKSINHQYFPPKQIQTTKSQECTLQHVAQTHTDSSDKGIAKPPCVANGNQTQHMLQWVKTTCLHNTHPLDTKCWQHTTYKSMD